MAGSGEGGEQGGGGGVEGASCVAGEARRWKLVDREGGGEEEAENEAPTNSPVRGRIPMQVFPKRLFCSVIVAWLSLEPKPSQRCRAFAYETEAFIGCRRRDNKQALGHLMVSI